MQKDYISLKDVADRWKVSRQTARRNLRRMGVSAVRVGGGKTGTIRYEAAAVTEAEERMREKP